MYYYKFHVLKVKTKIKLISVKSGENIDVEEDGSYESFRIFNPRQ